MDESAFNIVPWTYTDTVIGSGTTAHARRVCWGSGAGENYKYAVVQFFLIVILVQAKP